ncbi:MAG: DedA family protein [Candidatus Rokubacteria bacterium]|nr:DedA family protein [Candidatus Rokubacteria bacterium]
MVLSGAMATDLADAGWLLGLGVAGTVIGDHVLYLLGIAGGERVLTLYCRWTVGSQRCITDARAYFERWGGFTIVIGRFVTGVRLFASALAGAGGIAYPRFLLFDVVGALVWTGLFVSLGYWLGERAARLLERYGPVILVIGLGIVVAGVAVLVYRVIKRRRHSPATMPRPRTT